MSLKKILLITLCLLGGLFGLAFLVKTSIGDLRPAFLPSKPTELQPFIVSPLKPKLIDFAQKLSNARDLEISPKGTIILSIPDSGKVVALPDKDKNGQADRVKDVLTGLDRPHGLAFYQGKLFVAEETRVVRYMWDEQNLTATQEQKILDLPKGGNHFTRTLVFNKKGQLFVTLGSTCNVCTEKHPWLAAVIVSDQEGYNPRLFAKGLRNSVFLATNPSTDDLWATEMGRDLLGDSLPPDEVNILHENEDYGWPHCYGNKIRDIKFQPNNNFDCTKTEPPAFEISAHFAPLGLVFINSPKFPQDWQGDLLVAYHGSWNRSTPGGYKVVRLKVGSDNKTIEGEEDFLTGFLKGSEAIGRPVDMVFDLDGNLYFSDDKAGKVYRVENRP